VESAYTHWISGHDVDLQQEADKSLAIVLETPIMHLSMYLEPKKNPDSRKKISYSCFLQFFFFFFGFGGTGY
jgi:hypothetical protein